MRTGIGIPNNQASPYFMRSLLQRYARSEPVFPIVGLGRGAGGGVGAGVGEGAGFENGVRPSLHSMPSAYGVPTIERPRMTSVIVGVVAGFEVDEVDRGGEGRRRRPEDCPAGRQFKKAFRQASPVKQGLALLSFETKVRHEV
jgi:hypothetical protein